MKRMKLLCAWSLLCDCSSSKSTLMVSACLHSWRIPRPDFPTFAIHNVICCCEHPGPITCWISEHWEDVLAGTLGGLCHLHHLICWDEQDAMRRYLLGNRIWSKYFCNVIFVSWYNCKIENQLSLVWFFNEVGCNPKILCEEDLQICCCYWLLKISTLMFVSALSLDFYYLPKAFFGNNRVTVAGRITREKGVTFVLSFFQSAVVSHPLNITGLADRKVSFFHQQGL